ncbi:MAG: phytanoyl-CoA dioxygenase family protein [Alphaproteobacteria bacterium]|nr:phytanoyl-CoA dioxygenase family protein [Alphaproteobacteria bacterium]
MQQSRMTRAETSAIIAPAQRVEFNRDGFLILRGALKEAAAFHALINELENYARTFATDFSLSNPASVLALAADDRTTLYCGLRYLPSLYRFVSDDLILSISRALGIAFPGIELFNNIRMDLPGEDQYLFQWHQDITYNLGSANCLTYWIPLSKTGAHYGGIEVIPGSHKRGIWPCEVVNPQGKSGLLTTRDIVITEQPQTPPVTLETEFGDLVVFSQMLLHKSLSNRSDNVRWTVQIRHSDFMEPYFRHAAFPMGDLTTLDKTSYLEEWTKDHGQDHPK